jgi:hypothetical protein
MKEVHFPNIPKYVPWTFREIMLNFYKKVFDATRLDSNRKSSTPQSITKAKLLFAILVTIFRTA